MCHQSPKHYIEIWHESHFRYSVYEVEPPREWDELPPVIFLNAPETFRPKPFMMEQKYVQLETGYVSETEMNILTRE